MKWCVDISVWIIVQLNVPRENMVKVLLILYLQDYTLWPMTLTLSDNQQIDI